MLDAAGLARAAVVWLLLSVACIVAGEALTRPLLPVIALVGDWIRPGFQWALGFEMHENALNVMVRATTEGVVRASPNSGLPPGVSVRAGATTAHLLLPSVIWLSVLAAVRVENWRQRLALTAVGLLASQVLAAVMGAILLAAKLEMLLTQVALQANERRVDNWVVESMVFIETGGNVVFALLGAAVCLALPVRWRLRRTKAGSHPPDAGDTGGSLAPAGPASGSGTPAPLITARHLPD